MVKSSLNPIPAEDIKPETEFAVCVIKPALGKHMLIRSVYHPEKWKEHNLRKICDTFDNISNMNCIIAGDINFPFISWDDMSSTDRLSNVLLNTLNESMLHNVYLSPSRGNNILDLIVTGNPDIIYSIEIEEPVANSDHNSVRIEMRIPVKRVNEYPRTIYLYSKEDYENMNEELDQISLNKYDL